MEKKSCPYCKKRLTKIPQRKTNCEFCKKDIFVRTIPSSMEMVLIKESEIKEVEKLWIEYLCKSFWFRELIKLGTSKNSATKMYYILKERFGGAPLIADVMWGVFNNASIDAMKEGDKNKQESIQKLMNRFREVEKAGGELWAS